MIWWYGLCVPEAVQEQITPNVSTIACITGRLVLFTGHNDIVYTQVNNKYVSNSFTISNFTTNKLSVIYLDSKSIKAIFLPAIEHTSLGVAEALQDTFWNVGPLTPCALSRRTSCTVPLPLDEAAAR